MLEDIYVNIIVTIANYQQVLITDYLLLIIIDYLHILMWLTLLSVDHFYIHIVL